MKICNFDFIVLFILVFIAIFIYDFVKSIVISSEGFQDISQLYQADLNSIRNLLGIVPAGTGNDTLNIGSNVNISGSTTMNNSIISNRLAIGNDTLIKGKAVIGRSNDGVSSTITDSAYDSNSLCLVGQGTAPNRKITMWDNVQVQGNLVMPNKSVIDLGAGDNTRETNAGKIGYNIFDDSLNIVGKGRPGEPRRTTIWDNLEVRGNINNTGDFVFNGDNKWIIHTPDDRRKTLYIAPWKDSIRDWDWNNQIRIEPNGVIYAKGFERY